MYRQLNFLQNTDGKKIMVKITLFIFNMLIPVLLNQDNARGSDQCVFAYTKRLYNILARWPLYWGSSLQYLPGCLGT